MRRGDPEHRRQSDALVALHLARELGRQGGARLRLVEPPRETERADVGTLLGSEVELYPARVYPCEAGEIVCQQTRMEVLQPPEANDENVTSGSRISGDHRLWNKRRRTQRADGCR